LTASSDSPASPHCSRSARRALRSHTLGSRGTCEAGRALRGRDRSARHPRKHGALPAAHRTELRRPPRDRRLGSGTDLGLELHLVVRLAGRDADARLRYLRRSRQAVTPLQIANGAGDAYLIALNNAISIWGKPLYIRPMGEMNGHWNPYCAYTASGRPKGASHSTAAFRKAFARIYVILHGGTMDEMNAKLRRLELHPVDRDLPGNAYPQLQVVWNPQGYGSPDVPGNSAQAYYPGDAYVDVVGDDLYDIRFKAEWPAAEKLYDAHPSKPFAFPEWGLWAIDDPSFVRAMAKWIKTHRRTELVSYFKSSPGAIWDLASKPKSL